MKYFYIILLLAGQLLSQSRIGEWNAYTSPLYINDLIEYNHTYCMNGSFEKTPGYFVYAFSSLKVGPSSLCSVRQAN